MKITVRENKDAKPFEIEFSIPPTVEGKVKRYGEALVNGYTDKAIVVSIQAFLRGKITSGVNKTADLQKLADTWKPGLKSQKKPSKEKVQKMLSRLDPETRKALLAEYGANKTARA